VRDAQGAEAAAFPKRSKTRKEEMNPGIKNALLQNEVKHQLFSVACTPSLSSPAIYSTQRRMTMMMMMIDSN
jgi:hypothetical protein